MAISAGAAIAATNAFSQGLNFLKSGADVGTTTLFEVFASVEELHTKVDEIHRDILSLQEQLIRLKVDLPKYHHRAADERVDAQIAGLLRRFDTYFKDGELEKSESGQLVKQMIEVRVQVDGMRASDPAFNAPALVTYALLEMAISDWTQVDTDGSPNVQGLKDLRDMHVDDLRRLIKTLAHEHFQVVARRAELLFPAQPAHAYPAVLKELATKLEGIVGTREKDFEAWRIGVTKTVGGGEIIHQFTDSDGNPIGPPLLSKGKEVQDGNRVGLYHMRLSRAADGHLSVETTSLGTQVGGGPQAGEYPGGVAAIEAAHDPDVQAATIAETVNQANDLHYAENALLKLLTMVKNAKDVLEAYDPGGADLRKHIQERIVERLDWLGLKNRQEMRDLSLRASAVEQLQKDSARRRAEARLRIEEAIEAQKRDGRIAHIQAVLSMATVLYNLSIEVEKAFDEVPTEGSVPPLELEVEPEPEGSADADSETANERGPNWTQDDENQLRALYQKNKHAFVMRLQRIMIALESDPKSSEAEHIEFEALAMLDVLATHVDPSTARADGDLTENFIRGMIGQLKSNRRSPPTAAIDAGLLGQSKTQKPKPGASNKPSFYAKLLLVFEALRPSTVADTTLTNEASLAEFFRDLSARLTERFSKKLEMERAKSGQNL